MLGFLQGDLEALLGEQGDLVGHATGFHVPHRGLDEGFMAFFNLASGEDVFGMAMLVAQLHGGKIALGTHQCGPRFRNTRFRGDLG